MADERTITTVFRADISQFSASTQDLNRYISQVNSEFKNATASMGRWNDNAAGLQAKLNQLNGVLDAETKKLSTMEQAYADLVAQGKENTKEAQQLATAINNQSAKVKETQKNINYYTASLNELKDAGVSTTDELKNVNKALAEQARVAEQEAAEAAKAAAKAQEELNKKLEDQKQAAKEAGDALVKGAAVGIAGIATACVGAIAGLTKLVDETKELRTQMGMLETAFTENNLSAEAATKTYGEFYGVLGDSGKATEASLHLGELATSEEQLESLTHSLTGVYARFGDSLPLEGLAEGAQITASLGEVNGTMADALEFAGHSVDDFNAELALCNSEEERAQLVTDKLNSIYGESATKYKEVNKEVIEANKAQNEYNQAMADIGEKAQPIVTEFKTAMVGVLQTILAKFNEVDIAGLVKKISDAITSLVNTVLPPLMSTITWILDNLDWLVPVLGSVIGLIGGIVGAIKTYNAIMKIARTVQLLWNAALMANPIGLIIAAIGLLVGAFVLLWNKCEGFRNFWKSMWEGIKTAASAAGNFIKGIFSGIMNTVKGVINTIISGINGAIKAINKIKVNIPDWVPKYGGKKFGFNLKTIPKLAQGGLIDKPTLAMVGEAGKEAVMPLENNTQWIDKLADKLNAKQTANNTYNITNKFEKMETSRLALHKSNLELKRLIRG